jgi:hypothetical protein
MTNDWKLLILQRYSGEFPPAGDSPNPIRKSSEDIAFELSGMGEFSPDEVSAFMAISGYTIEFDDGRPVWLLRNQPPDNALPE